jgi:molecular chaperone HscB
MVLFRFGIFAVMDYFERYGIPVALKVDRSVVKKKYYELSREFHPDFYSQSDPEKQREALQISAEVNKAYRTFSNSDDTIRYLLQLKGLLQDEEKYDLDPMFLGEVMEINEQLMEIEMDERAGGLGVVEDGTNQLLDKIYNDVAEIVENYQESTGTEEELLRVKEYYFRKKYILRILDKIGQLRNIASP